MAKNMWVREITPEYIRQGKKIAAKACEFLRSELNTIGGEEYRIYDGIEASLDKLANRTSAGEDEIGKITIYLPDHEITLNILPKIMSIGEGETKKTMVIQVMIADQDHYCENPENEYKTTFKKCRDRILCSDSVHINHRATDLGTIHNCPLNLKGYLINLQEFIKYLIMTLIDTDILKVTK